MTSKATTFLLPTDASFRAPLGSARGHGQLGKTRLAEPLPHDHLVQFYEDDAFLCDTVAQFLAGGLASGESIIVVATEAHREGFRQRLCELGLGAQNDESAVVWLDARETLARFMVGDAPDRELFQAAIGGALARACGDRAPTHVRAYGEMVDLLWQDGQQTAALRLEELWCELVASRPISLLCAYAMDGFHREAEVQRFRAVCERHGHVVPAESFVRLDGDAARLREIAELQQRARALEAEVAHRRQLELALRDTLAQLRQSQEECAGLLVREQAARDHAELANHMKDEFIAVLSHELRTPLSAILGWAQTLQEGGLGAAEQQHGLETIVRSARAQAQLVEDVLDISRITAGQLRLDRRDLDLSGILRAAVDAAQPTAGGKRIQIDVILEPGAGWVNGDADRLQQVIGNLLTNAIKFTPRAGRVEVRLSRRDRWSCVSVRDTGRGIRDEFLPFVFDRFRQADTRISRSSGGLGLGLSIVRQLVELHGGTVSAESAGEGQGSIFSVCLPWLAPAAPAAGPDDAERTRGKVASLAGIRVLLVDDVVDVRELVMTVLARRGATVKAVGSAAEALEAIQEWRPHVLVSDIGLPGEDGYDLIRQARQMPSERGGLVPAVALTAYAGVEDARRAVRAGYQMHVPKPVEMGRLVEVIRGLAAA